MLTDIGPWGMTTAKHKTKKLFSNVPADPRWPRSALLKINKEKYLVLTVEPVNSQPTLN